MEPFFSKFGLQLWQMGAQQKEMEQLQSTILTGKLFDETLSDSRLEFLETHQVEFL